MADQRPIGGGAALRVRYLGHLHIKEVGHDGVGVCEIAVGHEEEALSVFPAAAPAFLRGATRQASARRPVQPNSPVQEEGKADIPMHITWQIVADGGFEVALAPMGR